MGERLIIVLNKSGTSYDMDDDWIARRNAKRSSLGSPMDYLAWNAANPGKPKDERGRWTDSKMDQMAQKLGLFKVDEGIFVKPTDIDQSLPYYRNEYGHAIVGMSTLAEEAARDEWMAGELAEESAERLAEDMARGPRGAFERFWRRPVAAQGYENEAMYIGRGRFSVTEKAVLKIDLAKRRGAVGKKLKGAGNGGETVASWNAANPKHPRDAKGRFAETAGAAAGAVGDLLRSMVKEHGGERTKLGKALMDMVGPGESVSAPNLTPDAKLRNAEAMFGSDRSRWTAAQRAQAARLEGAGGHAVATSTGKPAKASESLNPYEAKRPRIKLGNEEKVKRLNELSALSKPTADDEAEFDKVLSTMTVAEMKAWLASQDRVVYNPGKKDAFRKSITGSIIGSKRDRNAILGGKWSAGIGPSDDQLKGAETAARLRSALASIQDGGLNEANEADFRQHLAEMTPAELDAFRKEHDIPGTSGLQIRANAIKIFIEGRKRTAAVMGKETERFPGDKHGGDAKFMADLERARKDYPEIGRYVEGPAALEKIVAEKQAEGIAKQLSGATPAERKQILGMVADSRLEAVAHASGVPVRKEWSGQVLRDNIARHLEAFAVSNTRTGRARTPSNRIPPDATLNAMSVKALRDLYQELTGTEIKPSSARLKRDVIAAIKHDVGMGSMLSRESKAWNDTKTAVDAENARRAAADDADFAKFQAERARAQEASQPAGNSFPRSNVKWDWEKIKEDNMTMHGDSASMELAQALQRAGREADASYVADMRFRTSNTRGERSPDDLERMVDDLKAMMAREQDPGLRARYQRALEDIDAPARPVPDLPGSTPPILRRIVEDLNKIPNARRTGHFAGTHKDISVVERLARVIRKVDEGDRDTYRTWDMQMRDALHSLHESVDGAMRMWTLAELLDDPEIRTWVRSRRPGS